ncbi:MAG TPA: hypothetical protein VFR23_03375 [Jiangellaceae bacterium]|nr:hypothetical protein [Jiangellaceae bacterium]
MNQGRPLHTVFTELLGDEVARQAYAADPSGLLDAAGHHDLPEELVAEAIVSFVDTAAPDVAEHLAPFVMAHSAVPSGSEEPPAASNGLDLLASAPGVAVEFAADGPSELLDSTDAGDVHPDAIAPAGDLDFGVGALDMSAPTDFAAASLSDVPTTDESPAESLLPNTIAEDVLPTGQPPAPEEPDLDDDGFAES